MNINAINENNVKNIVNHKETETIKKSSSMLNLNEKNQNINDISSYPNYEAKVTDNAMVSYNAYIATDNVISLNSSDGIQLQSALNNMGFYNAAFDGNVSSTTTQQAIKNFERVFLGTSTGTLTENLLTKIYDVNDEYTSCLNSTGMTYLATELDMTLTHKKNAALTWVFLQEGMGLNKMQAAAAMGNIFAESAFSCANAQNTSGYPGDDNYSYVYDTTDGVGYGLMQWTHSSRKMGLNNMATSMSRSVSNLGVQLAYLRAEAEGTYRNGWNLFKQATSLNQASDIFVDRMLQPASPDYQARRSYSLMFYNNLS